MKAAPPPGTAPPAPERRRVGTRSLVVLAVLIAALSGGSQWLAGRMHDRLGDEVVRLARPGDIHMISSVTCPYCVQARQWLTENEVPFTECFVERDEACRTAFEALPVRGTPTMVVRGQVQTGFSAQKVRDALQASDG